MNLKDAMNELKNENIRFKRLIEICRSFFVGPRINGSNHIFKVPWSGNPRINLQKDGQDAKKYQIKQVREALKKLSEIEMLEEEKKE
ncbi:MAG: toxin HicA [Oligoflexia bacterium]|nr:toxin HicA [Oligoflexia bacterium]